MCTQLLIGLSVQSSPKRSLDISNTKPVSTGRQIWQIDETICVANEFPMILVAVSLRITFSHIHKHVTFYALVTLLCIKWPLQIQHELLWSFVIDNLFGDNKWDVSRNPLLNDNNNKNNIHQHYHYYLISPTISDWFVLKFMMFWSDKIVSRNKIVIE